MPESRFLQALAALNREVRIVTRGEKSIVPTEDLGITPNRRRVRERLHLFTWRRVGVFFLLGCLYFFLVVYVTLHAASKEGIVSISDPRFVAKFLAKMLDWLFVPGPEVMTTTVGGVTTYSLPWSEIGNWLAMAGLVVLGWGSIISIPTFIVDSFIAKAGLRDEKVKDKVREEEKLLAQARVDGRLEVAHPAFNAILTYTHDPIAPFLVHSLGSVSQAKPWVLIQTGVQHNTIGNLTDHVYLPDLSSNIDYNNLLHASRLAGNTVVILADKPGYKFLADPDKGEVDLTTGDIVTFIENVNARAGANVRYIIAGTTDARSTSAPYKGHVRRSTASLAEVAREMKATLIDTDELIVRQIYKKSAGKPVYLEFTGTQEQIDTYHKRLDLVMSRLRERYPIRFTDIDSKPTGGVFFVGQDVEGVALTKARLGLFDDDLPHYVIFEPIDRYDEVEAIGFSPICIDYELAREILKQML